MLSPTGAVGSLGIPGGGLSHGIKAPAAARVDAPAGDVEPVALVAVDVIVQQLRFEPCRPGTPVAAQLMYEVAGCHLAQAVAQVTGGRQLAHGRVHQRLARLSGAPCRKTAAIVRRGAHGPQPARPVQCAAVLQVQQTEIVAPQQLEPQPVAAIAGAVHGLELPQLRPRLPG